MNFQNLIKKVAFHPWLLTAYFPLVFFYMNIQHLLPYYLFRVLLVGFILTTLLFIILSKITGKNRLSAIIVSVDVLTMFSFPTVNYLIGKRITELSTGIHIPEKFVWAGLIAFIFILELFIFLWLDKKSRFFLDIMTVGLNITAITLIGFILVSFYTRIAQLSEGNHFSQSWDSKINAVSKCSIESGRLPDIYLIILDGYGSKEVLQTIYDYDNSEFEQDLEALGFQVIENGRTNYSQTRTSLSSLLNLGYLDYDLTGISEYSEDSRPFITMISNNKVARFLKNYGYQIIDIPSGYQYSENMISDKVYKDTVYFTNFDETILSSSLVSPLINDTFYEIQADHIEFQTNTLSSIPGDSPKFVFAHIYAPHPPFVFDRDGNHLVPPYFYAEVDSDSLLSVVPDSYYRNQYREQVEYISGSIKQTVEKIISASDVPPIIIIQGDHGPGLTVSQGDLVKSNHYERMHILNAIYLPGGSVSDLPPGHTPVNTFPEIFNRYFGCNLDILENKSYVSSFFQPYHFVDVTDLLDNHAGNSQ